ncbi:hypothetical protein TNCV_4607281 [Trichonephila clavipes]|nr:hypothetical protein TNCV_4607281 [Trichonephila clavipes]
MRQGLFPPPPLRNQIGITIPDEQFRPMISGRTGIGRTRQKDITRRRVCLWKVLSLPNTGDKLRKRVTGKNNVKQF